MNKLLFTFIVSMAGLLMSFNVFALACYSIEAGGAFGGGIEWGGGTTYGGVSNFRLDPSASVPEASPDGTIIWRGPSTTVQVTCYKDVNAQGILQRPYSEQVYFWPGRTGKPGTPNISGIKIGFRYKGRDIFGQKVAVDNFVVPRCRDIFELNHDCEIRTQTTRTITYQPIIIASAGTFINYNDVANIFQVDGEKGYNSKFSNYHSQIGNMYILEPSKCEVSLSIENNNVDFGLLRIDDVVSGKLKPLSIRVVNEKFGVDCPKVKLRGYFENIKDVNNNDYIPVYDELNTKLPSLGIKIYDGGKQIILNEPIGSGFQIGQVGFRHYQAKLFARDPANITEGKFNAMVVYMVSFL